MSDQNLSQQENLARVNAKIYNAVNNGGDVTFTADELTDFIQFTANNLIKPDLPLDEFPSVIGGDQIAPDFTPQPEHFITSHAPQKVTLKIVYLTGKSLDELEIKANSLIEKFHFANIGEVQYFENVGFCQQFLIAGEEK